MDPTACRLITSDEYFEMANGAFRSASALCWYAEREPDSDFRQFAIVAHPTRFILAVREKFAGRN